MEERLFTNSAKMAIGTAKYFASKFCGGREAPLQKKHA